MALGQQQGRPVTPVEFTITTVTGEVTALKTLVEAVPVDGDDGDYTITDSSGVAGDDLQVSFNVASGDVTINSIVDGGTGYAPDDAVSFDLSGITGGTAGTMTAAVDTILGEAATTTVTDGGTGWITGDALSVSELSSDGSGTGFSGTVTASALNFDTPETGGVVSAITIVTGGTGYVGGDAETLTYIGTGEVGISDVFTYYNHNQYELGGQIDEYKTGTGAIVTVGTGDVTTIVAGGVDYRVGDVLYAMGGDNGADLTVDTVDADGAITGFTAGGTGVGYTDGDYNTVFVSRTLKTDATGEYAGANSDNDPTISVGRLADQEQLIVQQRDIDGGAITVFAEPTTVNSVGDVVGNTIRAEDITDEYRCVAVTLSDGATSRYVWDATGAGGNTGSNYGFCREKTPTELSGAALVDADCPAGYVHSGGDCVARTHTDINTDEGNDTINAKTAMEQCLAAGDWYEPSAAKGSRCIDGTSADNFSLANFSFTTNSSAQDYARTVCQQMGYEWHPDFTCNAVTDVTTLVTQATCVAAGHVWVAGTCYNKADFGDGYSRQGNAGNTDPDVQPK